VVPEKASQPRIGKLRREPMKRILILFSLVLALIIASTTYAAPPASAPNPFIKNLAGAYAVTGTKSCVQAYTGAIFYADKLLPNVNGGYGNTRVYKTTGILTLDGPSLGNPDKGKGFISLQQLTIFNSFPIPVPNGPAYPTTIYTGTCDVEYYGGGSSLLFIYKNCMGTENIGIQAGWASGSDVEIKENAAVSADGMTIISWDVDDQVEYIWATSLPTSDPPNTTYHYQRKCGRTGTAIRLK
jgi:hypothetical protein